MKAAPDLLDPSADGPKSRTQLVETTFHQLVKCCLRIEHLLAICLGILTPEECQKVSDVLTPFEFASWSGALDN